MSASILHQVKLKRRYDVVDVWCLRGLDFVNDGTRFSIVASAVTGEDLYDVVHTVKNTETGRMADIQMNNLIKILLKSE